MYKRSLSLPFSLVLGRDKRCRLGSSSKTLPVHIIPHEGKMRPISRVVAPTLYSVILVSPPSLHPCHHNSTPAAASIRQCDLYVYLRCPCVLRVAGCTATEARARARAGGGSYWVDDLRTDSSLSFCVRRLGDYLVRSHTTFFVERKHKTSRTSDCHETS